MKRYDADNMERSTRSMINRATAIEIFEGRGSENGAVFIDIRHVYDRANEGSCADVVNAFKKAGVDLKVDLLEVTSCPHTYLGGVKIDEFGRSTVEGLYAGGEAAGGVHGANRLDGAALIDSYVFGYRAGSAAANESKVAVRREVSKAVWKEQASRALESASAGREITVGEWRRRVQELVVTCLGQVRRADRLAQGLEHLETLKHEADNVTIEGETQRQMFDSMRRRIETENLIEVATMLGTAARMREESRGGHFRIDFPETDDDRFLGNFVVRRDGGALQCSYAPAPERPAASAVVVPEAGASELSLRNRPSQAFG